ncbi:MAG: hypothetical protein WCP32_09750 [Bacteroidota bacterium]
MLSGILNSDIAIQVNISIIREFVHRQRFLDSNKELSIKMKELEKAITRHDEKINRIFQSIKMMLK